MPSSALLPPCMPACSSPCMPVCSSPSMPVCSSPCMPVCSSPCMPACSSSCMPACSSPCMPACSSLCMPACSAAAPVCPPALLQHLYARLLFCRVCIPAYSASAPVCPPALLQGLYPRLLCFSACMPACSAAALHSRMLRFLCLCSHVPRVWLKYYVQCVTDEVSHATCSIYTNHSLDEHFDCLFVPVTLDWREMQALGSWCGLLNGTLVISGRVLFKG